MAVGRTAEVVPWCSGGMAMTLDGAIASSRRSGEARSAGLSAQQSSAENGAAKELILT
jgi:hypothetical protein